MIASEERQKVLAVPLCGERALARLESIGVARIANLRARDPWDVVHEIKLEAGRMIWRAPVAIAAPQNLIDAAEREGTSTPARGHERARVAA